MGRGSVGYVVEGRNFFALGVFFVEVMWFWEGVFARFFRFLLQILKGIVIGIIIIAIVIVIVVIGMVS